MPPTTGATSSRVPKTTPPPCTAVPAVARRSQYIPTGATSRSRKARKLCAFSEPRPSGSGWSGFPRRIGDAVDFDADVRPELANDRSAGRFGVTEELGIDLVHLREIGVVRQIHTDLDNVGQRRPDAFEQPLHVVQRDPCFVFDVAHRHLIGCGIHRYLAGEKDEVSRAHGR